MSKVNNWSIHLKVQAKLSLHTEFIILQRMYVGTNAPEHTVVVPGNIFVIKLILHQLFYCCWIYVLENLFPVIKDAIQIFFRKFCFPNHEYIGQTRYAAYHMHIIRFEIEFSVQSMRQRKFWKSLKLTNKALSKWSLHYFIDHKFVHWHVF